jgi:hypothetical protein
MVTAPPAPPVADPVVIVNAPVVPNLDVPVDKTISPLTPLSLPELAVVMYNEPLVDDPESTFRPV